MCVKRLNKKSIHNSRNIIFHKLTKFILCNFIYHKIIHITTNTYIHTSKMAETEHTNSVQASTEENTVEESKNDSVVHRHEHNSDTEYDTRSERRMTIMQRNLLAQGNHTVPYPYPGKTVFFKVVHILTPNTFEFVYPFRQQLFKARGRLAGTAVSKENDATSESMYTNAMNALRENTCGKHIFLFGTNHGMDNNRSFILTVYRVEKGYPLTNMPSVNDKLKTEGHLCEFVYQPGDPCTPPPPPPCDTETHEHRPTNTTSAQRYVRDRPSYTRSRGGSMYRGRGRGRGRGHVMYERRHDGYYLSTPLQYQYTHT